MAVIRQLYIARIPDSTMLRSGMLHILLVSLLLMLRYRITEPAVLSANVASTNVTCNGADDGTITITNPLGGYGTYEYSINGGAAWQQQVVSQIWYPAAMMYGYRTLPIPAVI